jgi:DNA-binding GntR family transcriptional regulator
VLQRPETLTSAVARFIRDAIMRGDYLPGQALPEVWQAEQLQTSRGTIREALRTLADQGLVETIPHRGSFVATLTPRKAYEIYTLRAELESYAVRLAMERGGYGPADLDALRATLAQLDVTQREVDQFELAEVDMQFHELLSHGSGHQVLLDTLGSLRLQMRQFIVYTKLMGSDEEPEFATHQRLLASVEAGDTEAAAAAVRHHILEAGQLLMRKLACTNSDDESLAGAGPNSDGQPTRSTTRRPPPGGENGSRS